MRRPVTPGCGYSSEVERQLPKLNVASSILATRSNLRMSVMRDDAQLIEDLAVPHRAREAYRAMLQAGPRLLPLVMANLEHPDAAVRTHCCRYLDHYLAPESLGELVALLDDPDPKVRAASMHALACDKCKEGACRPDAMVTLRAAMRLLANDPDDFVRAMAVEVVALSVHTQPEAEAALVAAVATDGCPTVRKKARWFVPAAPFTSARRPNPSASRGR